MYAILQRDFEVGILVRQIRHALNCQQLNSRRCCGSASRPDRFPYQAILIELRRLITIKVE